MLARLGSRAALLGSASRRRTASLCVEQLEDRLTPVSVVLDYRFDTGFFVGHPERQTALQAAANNLASRFFDELTAIAPGGSNSWQAVFTNPATGVQTQLANLTIPANTLLVFAAGAPVSAIGAPAAGGPGGGGPTSGDQAWFDTVLARGQTGALAATPTDFGPWGGMVQFDVGRNWFAGVDPTGGAPGQSNLYKTALHEIGHVFGFGTTGSFFSRVSGASFTGPNAVARYGAPVPLGAGGHWVDGVRDQGVLTLMDPFASGTGFTALDIAGFADIGWQTTLPPAAPTPKAFAVGAGQGSVPHVKVYNPDGRERFSFYAYDVGYIGGVRVATADVNGDGFEDIITGTTPGTANGHVKVFDGQTGAEIRSFFTMPGVTAGIFVAGGDLNGDGKAEIVVGADAGVDGGQVLVFDGATNAPLADFRAFASPFLGGARVAVGDVTGDGRGDIIVGSGFGSTPHVKVFSGVGFVEVRSFFAYQSTFRGGVYVAAADFNSDNIAEIVTGAGAVAHVRVIDGKLSGQVGAAGEIADAAQLASFIATGPADAGFRGGPVSVVDVDGDGQTEVILELAGAPNSQVRTLNYVSRGVYYLLEPFPGFAGDIFLG